MLQQGLATPVAQFTTLVLGNSLLQDKLAQATDQQSFVTLAVAVGRAHGLDLSVAELTNILGERHAANHNELWLDDDLLESVAGKQAARSDTGTCTCRGCATVSTLGCHTGPGCTCNR